MWRMMMMKWNKKKCLWMPTLALERINENGVVQDVEEDFRNRLVMVIGNAGAVVRTFRECFRKWPINVCFLAMRSSSSR